MPLLDVSELLLDPDFCQPLTIERRTENTGTDGRNHAGLQIITPKPYGVILPVDTAIGGNAMEREPDMEYRGSAIEVITRFRIQGPAPGAHPDVIIHDGSRFVVTIVNSLAQYGAGFIRVEASSMNSVDDPPP